MNEITAFIAAVSHVTNIAKVFVQERDEIKRNAVYLEFNGALIDVQTKHLAIIQEHQSLLSVNETLKKQLADYNQWEKEKVNYSLKSVSGGGFVYAFNPREKSHDPPHWLCANCYSEHNKSILQYASMGTGDKGHFWGCPRCKSKIPHGEWPHMLKPAA